MLLINVVLLKPVKGQPYYFRHYQVENGLSNNTVFSIAQDDNGFMWFGTKDGLNRFDGYQFKVFQLTDGTGSQSSTDYIFSLQPDKNGRLWVGSMSGLYKFNAEQEKPELLFDSLHYVSNIQPDSKNRIWFLSGSTVCRYSLTTGALQQFLPNDYFSATSICQINDTIWIATTNGYLQRFEETTQQFITYDVFAHSPLPATKRIEKIIQGSNNTIYIGTQSQGIKRFTINKGSYEDILIYGSEKTPLFVRSILQKDDYEYWFTTESGIYIFNALTGLFTHLQKDFTNPHSLNDNATYAIAKDNEGSIWIGTYFGGINYYSRQNAVFEKYFPDNKIHSISGSVVGEITEDKYGNLWVGTEDNGLNKIDYQTGKITQFIPSGSKGSIAYTNIHGLAAIDDELWIGTFEHGIDVLNIKTGKVSKHYTSGSGKGQLKSNFAYRFLYTRTGSLYIGTTLGVFYYNKKENSFEQVPVVTENVYGKPMIEDHTGRIWFGTGTKGLYWFDPVTYESGNVVCASEEGYSLVDNIINDIYEDSHKTLWIATEGAGVCRIDSNRSHWQWYNVQKGFPRNFAFKILEDNNSRLWISTSKGLICFNPITQATQIYTRANGLLSDQFNRHSGFKDAKGKLYFGSAKGMIAFNPAELATHLTTPPPVFVTGFQVFDKELSIGNDSSLLQKSLAYTKEITLSHNQSSISIDFAALSYISPEMTEYSYRLKGLNDNWTTVSTNRKVYFTNLTPGKYVFEVKAGTETVLEDKITQLSIIITPPFWMTGWAKIIYITLGILMIYYLFKNYHRRQQNKKEKEIYKSKIDFFTNVAHEIRTPLTLIKGPVENLMEREHEMPEIKEDIACLNRNTNRLMDLATQILDFRQTEIKSYILDFEKTDIGEILKETFLSFQILAKKKKIDYKLNMPSQKIESYADKDALLKIFGNLIGNAVKYSEQKVDVTLFAPGNDSTIRVEFENDGYTIPEEMKEKIFEPFFRIKEAGHHKGAGIGLSLAKSLTELHKGTLNIDFTKKNINLFVLVLPYNPVS